MNQDIGKRGEFLATLLSEYRKINDFLTAHSTNDTWLFENFTMAEVAYTPMFMRFWFLEYVRHVSVSLFVCLPSWTVTELAKSCAVEKGLIGTAMHCVVGSPCESHFLFEWSNCTHLALTPAHTDASLRSQTDGPLIYASSRIPLYEH